MNTTFNVTGKIAEFHKELLKDLRGDKVTRAAAFNSLAQIANRVQQRGELTAGGKIGGGKYSTKELKSFGTAFSFSSIATKRQKKRRADNEDTEDQFDGGYKEFRESLGRQTAFIDLTLTGDMFRAFTVVRIGDEGWGIGFVNDLEHKKYTYHRDRFGEMLMPSKSELELAFKDVQQHVDDVIRNHSK